MKNQQTKTQDQTGLPLAESMLPFWRLILKAFTERISRSGLSFNAATVVAHLYLHPEDSEPAKLSEETCAPRQTMTFILDTLEQQNLAARSPHPNDRRKKVVTLTAKGRKLAKAMLGDLLGFENRALQDTGSPMSVEGVKHWLASYTDSLTRQNAEARS